MQILRPDLCIVGAGSGGLSVAAGAVQMGASVVLLENNKMGGDCLNYGCVPSKAIIAAARTVANCHQTDKFGIKSSLEKTDYNKVAQYIRDVIAEIAPNDSVERFTALGVTVISATAKFFDAKTVQASDNLIKARRFVIATGSSAMVPPIPGLNKTPFLINETIFNLTQQPEHLLIIGGGPIGCELAQAHLMLGTKVSLLEGMHILPKDDTDAVAVVRENLLKQGLHLYENIKVLKTAKIDDAIEVIIEQNGVEAKLLGSHLLVATGRKPNIENLNLEVANVEYHLNAINVDSRLRTSNKKIPGYALDSPDHNM